MSQMPRSGVHSFLLTKRRHRFTIHPAVRGVESCTVCGYRVNSITFNLTPMLFKIMLVRILSASSSRPSDSLVAVSTAELLLSSPSAVTVSMSSHTCAILEKRAAGSSARHLETNDQDRRGRKAPVQAARSVAGTMLLYNSRRTVGSSISAHSVGGTKSKSEVQSSNTTHEHRV